MLVIIPRRCSPPQPQISDLIDLPVSEDCLSRGGPGGVDEFSIPHAHPQVLLVVGPQQQRGCVASKKPLAQQPAASVSPDIMESELLAIPGRIDRPARHTNTRPQTADDCQWCLQISCESIREVIRGSSKQLAEAGHSEGVTG